MPHIIMVPEWYCPFCYEKFDTEEKAKEHISECNRNPHNHYCGYCIHGCLKGPTTLIHLSDCYCAYHQKNYTSHPQNIDCDKVMGDNGKMRPVKRTCKHWTYKGKYWWTPLKEYNDALRNYTENAEKFILELSTISSDPIYTEESMWTCDYCNSRRLYTNSYESVLLHESLCEHNPEMRHCATCIHGGSKLSEYGLSGTKERPMTHYCLLYDEPYWHMPYFKHCTIVPVGDGRTKKLKGTCENYKYKGKYDWGDGRSLGE